MKQREDRVENKGMSLLRLLMTVGPLFLLMGCPDPPPPGSDTVDVICNCRDSCYGDRITVLGLVCTDASDPDNVTQAAEFICEKKQTIGVNVCKIEDCVPGGRTVNTGTCPADNGDFNTGDFGQAVSQAVAPSTVRVEGDDVIDFDIVPETLNIETTQTGTDLFFASVVGTLATTEFESDGIFGNDDHTLSEGRLAASPFSVTLQPDGTFVVPPGSRNFIVTGKVDGDRMSLTLASVSLGGTYNEATGTFTLTGLVDADGADLNMNVNLTLAFTNRPPNAVAGDDAVVECDSTNGTGTTVLSGAGSSDPDGAADIFRYAWFVDGTEAATGQDVSVAVPLGQHEVSLSVADVRGSFDVDTLGVLVEDTTAAQITIVEPQAVEYTHSQIITLDYSVVDGCTGVDTTTPLLDGASTVGGHGLADGQAIRLLTELSLGPHTFSISATDVEGNASSGSVTFTIVVTAASIQEAVTQFVALGAITPASEGQFLLGKLEAAADARARGNCRTANNQYEAFINAVTAKTGRSITPAAAAILITDARYLIAHCP